MAINTGIFYPEKTAVRTAVHPYALRPASQADSHVLASIERDAFPAHWPPTRFDKEFGRPRNVHLVAARKLHDGEVAPRADSAKKSGLLSSLFTGIKNMPFIPPGSPAPTDYVAGYVNVWFVVDEAHIIAIGVRSDELRNGIGELLMIGALDAAIRDGAHEATLEVRQSNHIAQSLYRKYGFQPVGLRRQYYSDNSEDAIIMTTPPIISPEYRVTLGSLARIHAERWGYISQVAS
jgi:ribosomal-protein-alanine N-acetyltransferase